LRAGDVLFPPLLGLDLGLVLVLDLVLDLRVVIWLPRTKLLIHQVDELAAQIRRKNSSFNGGNCKQERPKLQHFIDFR
jgi:hypothetical protein